MADLTADFAYPGKPERRSIVSMELPIVEHDLTDQQWSSVSQAFQGEYARTPGRPRQLSYRSLLNGILYKHAKRCSWRDVPGRYGTRSSLFDYFRQWSEDGTLKRIAVLLRISELQPYVDELKRLEAYDEKLARRSAERRAAVPQSHFVAAAEEATVRS